METGFLPPQVHACSIWRAVWWMWFSMPAFWAIGGPHRTAECWNWDLHGRCVLFLGQSLFTYPVSRNGLQCLWGSTLPHFPSLWFLWSWQSLPTTLHSRDRVQLRTGIWSRVSVLPVVSDWFRDRDITQGRQITANQSHFGGFVWASGFAFKSTFEPWRHVGWHWGCHLAAMHGLKWSQTHGTAESKIKNNLVHVASLEHCSSRF